MNILLLMGLSPTSSKVHWTFLPESIMVTMLLIPSFLPQLSVYALRKSFFLFSLVYLFITMWTHGFLFYFFIIRL